MPERGLEPRLRSDAVSVPGLFRAPDPLCTPCLDSIPQREKSESSPYMGPTPGHREVPPGPESPPDS